MIDEYKNNVMKQNGQHFVSIIVFDCIIDYFICLIHEAWTKTQHKQNKPPHPTICPSKV